MTLPTGTVTLLLADVEGSTRMWESSREQARASMSDLDLLVAEYVMKFDGARPLEQGEGDSFVAGFARPTDALSCALHLQRQLSHGLLRVRMALHTGEIEVRDDVRYEGSTIIRTARIRDLSHGGQVLVSASTRDLVQDAMPEDADFVDLGSHPLKGLDRPERVYQLMHPELASTFPPLRSVQPKKGHLPVQLTSFVGRAAEIADVQRLVGDHRLVTLTGAGGCGKTRLAIEAVRDADDVLFCDLGPVGDPASVAQVLCSAIGARTSGHETDADIACARLARREALVVLDNCEHLIDACATLADALLRRCPDVHMLTTSREPLGVEGEVAWRVPSLEASEAAELFVERAAQTRPGFASTPENAEAIDRICARLEGIPLAIELAAARVRVLSVDQIAQGVADRFTLLGKGKRTSLPRQQTLEASVAWSHDLLTTEQRVLLRRVAAFAGGFSLAAAEHVVSDDDLPAGEVLELLSQLVDRSLVIADEGDRGTRYRMLETIRQFARERLIDANDARAVNGRHLDYFEHLMTDLAASVRTRQTRFGDALVMMETEYDNIRAATEWAIADRRHNSGLRLVNAMWSLWFRMRTAARMKEARRWLDELLESATDIDPETRCAALISLCYSTETLYDWEVGDRAGREAVAIALDLGNDTLAAQAYSFLGLAQGNQGLPEGIESLNQAIHYGRKGGDWLSVFMGLRELGYQHFFIGEIAQAKAHAEAAVAEATEQGLAPLAATARGVLGWHTTFAGEVDEGIALAEQAIATLEAGGDLYNQPASRMLVSMFEFKRGDLARARQCAQRGLDVALESGFALNAGFCRLWLARFDLLDGDHVSAEDHVARTERAMSLVSGQLCRVFVWEAAAVRALMALEDGDPSTARSLLDAARPTNRELGIATLPFALTVSAIAARRLGDVNDADAYVADALVYVQKGMVLLAPEPLEMCAVLRADVGADADAVRLLAAAGAARARFGTVPDADLPIGVPEAIERLRASLDTFDQLWDEGAALDVQDAIAYALRGRGSRQRPASGWDSLTPTERRVVDLVAEGLTTKQVAERLFVSPRTVSTHLSHIFGKLGVASRAELASISAKRPT